MEGERGGSTKGAEERHGEDLSPDSSMALLLCGATRHSVARRNRSWHELELAAKAEKSRARSKWARLE